MFHYECLIIKILNKLIPIQYTTLGHSIKGRSFGVLIQIDEKYKEDKGLLAHERVHVKQFLRLQLGKQMSSSIKLKNANGKTVSVTNSNANQTDKEVIYLNMADELANINKGN